MNCEVCKGACCEGFKLVFDLDQVQAPDEDFRRFQSYRRASGPIAVHLDIPCDNLNDGVCMIYKDRPNVCREFQVGSMACKSVIRMRRTDAQCLAIGEGHELF
jgi:Fe-S-cluster containining protein